jgi:uncharacterized protein YodC (DUF2158 family)
MTVERTSWREGFAQCIWFDEENRLQRGQFKTDSLQESKS